MKDDLEQALSEAADAFLRTMTQKPLRPTTLNLVWYLLLDLSLSPAVVDDFGVYSSAHYRALQAVVNTAADVSLTQIGEALDQALGNGEAIAAVVAQYAPEFKALRFETAWDTLYRGH